MNLKKIVRDTYRSIIWQYWSARMYELGKRSHFESQIIWHNPHGMSIGSDVVIKSRCRIEAIKMRGFQGIRLSIGNNTIMQQGCQVIAAERVTIGNNILIAGKVLITDHDHLYDHPTKPVSQLRDLRTDPVSIADGCWLGYGCAVLKGVTIGERSVIGTNAVVTHDIPPFSVAVGIPAKVIKSIK